MSRADRSLPDYQSYLLRLWREGAETAWRASLQSTATERIYHFATIEALFAFLNGQLDVGDEEAPTAPTAIQSET